MEKFMSTNGEEIYGEIYVHKWRNLCPLIMQLEFICNLLNAYSAYIFTLSFSLLHFFHSTNI